MHHVDIQALAAVRGQLIQAEARIKELEEENQRLKDSLAFERSMNLPQVFQTFPPTLSSLHFQ